MDPHACRRRHLWRCSLLMALCLALLPERTLGAGSDRGDGTVRHVAPVGTAESGGRSPSPWSWGFGLLLATRE